MKHYLSVFNHNVNWHEVGTYDDFDEEIFPL